MFGLTGRIGRELLPYLTEVYHVIGCSRKINACPFERPTVKMIEWSELPSLQGKIVKILVENEQAVEFGQPLMLFG